MQFSHIWNIKKNKQPKNYKTTTTFMESLTLQLKTLKF